MISPRAPAARRAVQPPDMHDGRAVDAEPAADVVVAAGHPNEHDAGPDRAGERDPGGPGEPAAGPARSVQRAGARRRVFATKAVRDLAGDLAEHLGGSGDVRGAGEWLDGQFALVTKPLKPHRDVLATQAVREQLLPLVEAYGKAKAGREVVDYGDQM